jgi:hypothetical protein
VEKMPDQDIRNRFRDFERMQQLRFLVVEFIKNNPDDTAAKYGRIHNAIFHESNVPKSDNEKLVAQIDNILLDWKNITAGREVIEWVMNRAQE